MGPWGMITLRGSIRIEFGVCIKSCCILCERTYRVKEWTWGVNKVQPPPITDQATIGFSATNTIIPLHIHTPIHTYRVILLPTP